MASEDELLVTATRAELEACVRLLARAVAALPAGADASDDEAGTGADAGATAAAGILARALAIVRASAPAVPAPQSVAEPAVDFERTADRSNQREELRVGFAEQAQVLLRGGGRKLGVKLINLSWSGAAVRASNLPVRTGQRLLIYLPAGEREFAKVLATVMWTAGGHCPEAFGLRFEVLTPQHSERLHALIAERACGTGDLAIEAHDRIVRRLEIEFSDRDELLETLHDAQDAGLVLTLPEPLEPDQSLLVCMSCGGAGPNLNLRLRVVEQQRLEGFGVDSYRVRLKFEHPPRQLGEFIAEAVGPRPAPGR
ncbi:MAG: PilZ domain-containing protein [Gammaproteobacteria bacterium]